MSGVKNFYYGENGKPLPQDVIYEREQALLRKDPDYEKWLDAMTKDPKENKDERD